MRRGHNSCEMTSKRCGKNFSTLTQSFQLAKFINFLPSFSENHGLIAKSGFFLKTSENWVNNEKPRSMVILRQNKYNNSIFF